MVYRAIYSKGQIKIQEMAFVLVFIIIFFAIAGLFVFKFAFSNVSTNVEDQRAQAANELVRKIADSAEFALTLKSEIVCSSCIDLDKVMQIKNRSAYLKQFWNLDYLKIETLYPNKTGECDESNYPDCRTITLIKNSNFTGLSSSAYVSLCRIDFKQDSYTKCELGRISASGRGINK